MPNPRKHRQECKKVPRQLGVAGGLRCSVVLLLGRALSLLDLRSSPGAHGERNGVDEVDFDQPLEVLLSAVVDPCDTLCLALGQRDGEATLDSLRRVGLSDLRISSASSWPHDTKSAPRVTRQWNVHNQPKEEFVATCLFKHITLMVAYTEAGATGRLSVTAKTVPFCTSCWLKH